MKSWPFVLLIGLSVLALSRSATLEASSANGTTTAAIVITTTNTLDAILAATPAAGTTIVVSSSANAAARTLSSSNDRTLPASVTLQIMVGAPVIVPTGRTFTINGSLNAGLYQIFSCVGTGKVVFGGAIARDYPQWFGALGDHTHDDTAAIQLAIDALRRAGGMYGSETFFPAGSYNHTGLVIYQGTRFIGAGRMAVRLNNTTTTTNSIGTYAGEVFQGQVTIAHLAMYGSDAATAGAGIRLCGNNGGDNARNSFIDDVFVYGHYDGVHVTGMTMGKVNNISIMNAVNDGILFDSANNAITIEQCYPNRCGRHGFNLYLTYSSIINCACDSCGGDAYHLFATNQYGYNNGVTFISCGAESNKGNAMSIELGRYISLLGFTAYNNGGNSIKLSGTCFVTIMGFSDSSPGGLSINAFTDPTYNVEPSNIIMMASYPHGTGGDGNGITGMKYMTRF
jgi:hypothetical protein